MTINDVLKQVDWPLLARQKLALMQVDAEWADGLLNFIDAVQDAAERDGHPVVWLSDAALMGED